MRRGGLASPRSLAIRQMATRREPRDFDRTNPISARGRSAQTHGAIGFISRSILQLAAPNEPNFGMVRERFGVSAISLRPHRRGPPGSGRTWGRPASQAIHSRRTRSKEEAKAPEPPASRAWPPAAPPRREPPARFREFPWGFRPRSIRHGHPDRLRLECPPRPEPTRAEVANPSIHRFDSFIPSAPVSTPTKQRPRFGFVGDAASKFEMDRGRHPPVEG